MNSVTLETIEEKKKGKLIRNFPKYLHAIHDSLVENFGEEAAEGILSRARLAYPQIVDRIPCFHTPMYDSLMVQAGKMAALKKGMNEAGISTEQFVKFNIEQTRATAKKIPAWVKRTAGKIYLSRVMRMYLKRVGKSVSKHGWPTRVIDGSKQDDYAMAVETRDCQMIRFWESIGEGDIKPYCTFFDFTAAELLGIGLMQESSIDSGTCRYCFSKKGTCQWPKPVSDILDADNSIISAQQ